MKDLPQLLTELEVKIQSVLAPMVERRSLGTALSVLRAMSGPDAASRRLAEATRVKWDAQRKTTKIIGRKSQSQAMNNDEIDFSKGTRGRIVPEESLPEGKVRTAIVLDEAVLDWFYEKADASGGKVRSYDLINEALKAWIALH